MVNSSTGWSEGGDVQGIMRGLQSNNVEKQSVNGEQRADQSRKEADFERQVLEAVEIRVREGNSWRNKVFGLSFRLPYGKLTTFSSHCTLN